MELVCLLAAAFVECGWDGMTKFQDLVGIEEVLASPSLLGSVQQVHQE